MARSIGVHLCLILCGLLPSFMVFAWQAPHDPYPGWYYKKGGEVVESEKEMETEPQPIKPELAAVEKPRYILPAVPELPPLPSREELWQLHPVQFQKMVRDYRQKAIHTMRPEDVRDALIIQDVASDKAGAYTGLHSLVLASTPDLNAMREYPTVKAGRAALVRDRENEIAGYIASQKSNYGLLYFTQQNCSFCDVQAEIIRKFLAKHGWEISVLDKDQNPMLALKFDVDIAPMVFVIKRNTPNKLVVANGVTALAKMEQNIYYGIRFLDGDVRPEQFLTRQSRVGGSFDPLGGLKK